jgi:stage V sporulation protein S
MKSAEEILAGGKMEALKVSSKSSPNAVAGAMASVLRQSGAVEVQVVGAGALNQAIKAMAIARGFVGSSDIDLICVPNFADIEIDGQSRTALRLLVEDRNGVRHATASSDGLDRHLRRRVLSEASGAAIRSRAPDPQSPLPRRRRQRQR